MKKLLDRTYPLLVLFAAACVWLPWAIRRTVLLNVIAMSQDARPFAYRVLLPITARALSRVTGAPLVCALIILVILSALGLYYAARCLVTSFGENDRADMTAFLSCISLLAISAAYEQKTYDLATGMFFTLSLALLAQGKILWYLLLFPITTLNRETAFLLVIFFALYYRHRLPVVQWLAACAYQGVVYLAIRLAIMEILVNNPGGAFLWSWPAVLVGHAKYWELTLALVALAGIVTYFIAQGWTAKPEFLRAALLVMFPVQLALYIIIGWPFEIRVFAETMPLIVILALYPLPARQPSFHRTNEIKQGPPTVS